MIVEQTACVGVTISGDVAMHKKASYQRQVCFESRLVVCDHLSRKSKNGEAENTDCLPGYG